MGKISRNDSKAGDCFDHGKLPQPANQAIRSEIATTQACIKRKYKTQYLNGLLVKQRMCPCKSRTHYKELVQLS